MRSAALSRYDQSGAAPLPGQSRQYSSNDAVNALHRPNHRDGATSVSPYQSSGTISERAKRALERRLRPHTTLSCYELAYALRISESTLWAILSGNGKSGPSGRVLFKLTEFFGGGFLNDIFGGPNVYCLDPREAKKAHHIQRIRELQAELEAMA